MIGNLNNLFEIFKPSDNVLNGRFIKIADHSGWTDGYIADLTGVTYDLMRAKALVKGIHIEGTPDTPKVKPLIPNDPKNEHEIEKVEFDLKSKSAILINNKPCAQVNPKFLAYFEKAYQKIGGISKLVVTGKLQDYKPVKVYAREQLIGLIMPVRVQT